VHCSDKFSSSKAALEHVVQTGESVVDKWKKFFDFQSQGRDVPLSFSLSYSLFPAAMPYQRVFSLMNAKWSAARNRMTVGLVKPELQVFVNYNVDSRAFHESVLIKWQSFAECRCQQPKINSSGGARVSGSVANNRP